MIHPVLLCGGTGTRLWPLSRKSYPKQFVALLGDETLFQATARRLDGSGFAAPVVVTAASYRFVVAEQLMAARIEPGAVLIEPDARNTAPAVLAAALHLAADDPDAVMLVAPCDHVIAEGVAFHEAVARAEGLARAGRIVTFGVPPTRAETGYGWLEVDGSGGGLLRFVEKPDAVTAERMLRSGRHLWNAGIFVFTARTIIAAFHAHAADMVAPVSAAVAGARADLGFLRLDPVAWGGVAAASLDHAVMERAAGLAAGLEVVPLDAGWSDLGGWDAVASAMPHDVAGNALGGAVAAIDCAGSLLRSDEAEVALVGIGLCDIIAVVTGDAVLVAHKSRAQDVRQAVTALRARGMAQAEGFAREHRPWGWYQTLAIAERFQVKRIVVVPGGVLSLQSHVHRAEHWVVVSGTARVTVDGEVRLFTENQSVYVPLGAVHRMENPGKVPLHVIEVQTGAYLGEDDITRYEDVYARGQDGGG